MALSLPEFGQVSYANDGDVDRIEKAQGLNMANRNPLYQVGEALVKQLQVEALLERNVDDDRPSPPECDPLSSAQSRRLPVTIN